ncbi:MAG: nuclease-related domain-containing protein [Aggregatilineales bacterium]
MRTEINERLVKRNRRIAQWLFFVSFGILIGAFFLTNQQALNPTASTDTLMLFLSSLVLPLGLVATLISVRMTNLWIRRPRPEIALREGLKGLSNRSVLYSYYHSPAQHVLVCPQGVFAIVTRFQDGTFTVRGDRWVTHGGAFSSLLRLLRQDGIGDPNHDALRAAQHLQKLLAPFAPTVEVKPLIVFVDPRARLILQNPSIPTLYAHPKQQPNLKDYLRDLPRDGSTLTPEQVRAFEAATVRG